MTPEQAKRLAAAVGPMLGSLCPTCLSPTCGDLSHDSAPLPLFADAMEGEPGDWFVYVGLADD